LDAAPDGTKGIEEQTRKLFEVCRLRDVLIITFVNKLDREGRDPFDPHRRDRGVADTRHDRGFLGGRHWTPPKTSCESGEVPSIGCCPISIAGWTLTGKVS
jgi:hypothetical protein